MAHITIVYYSSTGNTHAVAQAIEAGACRPRDIFASHQCQAQCAKCVCEMRQMIQDSREAFALAAE